MSLKYGVVCFLLLAVSVLLAIKSYETLTVLPVGIPDKGGLKRSETKPNHLLSETVSHESLSSMPYQSIAEKNIFSPERKEFPVSSSEAGMFQKPKVRPQVILYGITLAGNYQSASLVNPGRKVKKGERELMTVKLGELIGDYKVAKILSDKITLETEGDHFEVLLYDPKMLKRRIDIRTENKPAMISSAGASSTVPEEAKREALSAQRVTQSPTRSATGEIQRPAFPRELSEEPKEPGTAPVTPFPVTTQPIPGGMTPTTVTPPPAPSPVPAPMTPRPLTPTMVPQFLPVPPGMGTPVQPLPAPPSQTPGKN